MIPIKQPNPWSCYPAAVSMLTGIPIEELIEEIGHDGSKVIDPSIKVPANREAFIGCEMALALLNFGWAIVPIYAAPSNPDKTLRTGWPDIEGLQDVLVDYCDKIVVIAQRREKEHEHAYAWDTRTSELIDPLTGENIGCLSDRNPVVWFECLFETPSPIRHFETL